MDIVLLSNYFGICKEQTTPTCEIYEVKTSL